MAAAEQKPSEYTIGPESKFLLLAFLVLLIEAGLMVFCDKTFLYYLVLMLPFRITIWSLLFHYRLQVINFNLTYFCAVVTFPYLLVLGFATDWFFTIDLTQLSYYAGLAFLPLFFVFISLYFATLSLGICLEMMCFICLGIVAITQLFFFQGLRSFWYSLMMPYYKLAIVKYDVKLAAGELNHLVEIAASTMMSNLVVNYFLAPLLVSVLLVFYVTRHKKSLKDWLTLRMSWCAFGIAIPMFFCFYSVFILHRMQALAISWLSVASIGSIFEVVRFIPAVCGLSYLHFLVHAKEGKSSQYRAFLVSVSIFIFYFFGALMYPLCSFIGLLDRVVDLRRPDKKRQMSSIHY